MASARANLYALLQAEEAHKGLRKSPTTSAVVHNKVMSELHKHVAKRDRGLLAR